MGFGGYPTEPVTDKRLGATVDEPFTPTGHGGKHRERLVVVEKPAGLGANRRTGDRNRTASSEQRAAGAVRYGGVGKPDTGTSETAGGMDETRARRRFTGDMDADRTRQRHTYCAMTFRISSSSSPSSE